MKATQCSGYTPTNAYESVLTVQESVPTPILEDTPPAGFKNPMLVRILSVALAPGDVRVMTGDTRELQGPPSMPYTPGGDVCGIVVEMPKENKKKGEWSFCVGDRIAARFVRKPMGMLGEYALVSPDVCDKVPESISNDAAAALVSSATVAVIISDYIKAGDRVLIYGAGGGVGSHLCQAVRLKGASYVVGVGKDRERLKSKPISCDESVDYTKDDVFNHREWHEEPFDVVIDLVGGIWLKLADQNQCEKSIVKPAKQGGRYLTTTPDSAIFEGRSVWQILRVFLFPALWRATYTRIGLHRSHLPQYSYVVGLPSTSDIVSTTLSLADEGKLIPCIDDTGPFSFTTEGVSNAFLLQASRHAKGKVIIKVSEK
jgi:NADPH:quinone reductase-like Zn-dependent oxidoreductase